MSHSAQVFAQRPDWLWWGWSSKCVAIAVTIIVGWMIGQLLIVSVLAILSFVATQGVRPSRSLAVAIADDASLCRDEKSELQRLGPDAFEYLDQIDTSDAGSLLRLLLAIRLTSDRTDTSEALDHLTRVAKQSWERQLAPIDLAAEQAPLMGLGGSLLGLATSLSGGQGTDLMAGIGTMVCTTMAGCAGSFLLLGLASINRTSIDRHIAELRMTAAQLLGIDDQRNDNGFESLFNRS